MTPFARWWADYSKTVYDLIPGDEKLAEAAWTAALTEAARVPIATYHQQQAKKSTTHDDKLLDFALDVEYAILALRPGGGT